MDHELKATRWSQKLLIRSKTLLGWFLWWLRLLTSSGSCDHVVVFCLWSAESARLLAPMDPSHRAFIPLPKERETYSSLNWSSPLSPPGRLSLGQRTFQGLQQSCVLIAICKSHVEYLIRNLLVVCPGPVTLFLSLSWFTSKCLLIAPDDMSMGSSIPVSDRRWRLSGTFLESASASHYLEKGWWDRWPKRQECSFLCAPSLQS